MGPENLGNNTEVNSDAARWANMAGDDRVDNNAEPDSDATNLESKSAETNTDSEIATEQGDRQNEHAKSRAELRLDSYKERLEQIERELIGIVGERGELQDHLESMENAIELNNEEHEDLATKSEDLQNHLKKLKRGFFSKISSLVKRELSSRFNASSDNYEETEETLSALTRENKERKDTKQALDDTQEKLRKNETEGEELEEERASTVDQIDTLNRKVDRLNAEKARLERSTQELKEIVYNEGFEEAIADATGGVSVRRAIRNETRERREKDKAFNEDSEMLDLVQQKGSELLAKYAPGREMDSDKLEEARAKMEAVRKEAFDRIDSRIAILKNISETNTVKGSLMRLKNKFMQRLRGF